MIGQTISHYKILECAETMESFFNPHTVVKSVAFIVKLDGDRLSKSGKWPIFEGKKKVRDMLIEEVYKRIE